MESLGYDRNLPRLAMTCIGHARRLADEYEIARERFIDQKMREEDQTKKGSLPPRSARHQEAL